MVPGALKELAFQSFVLLYYNQVIGTPATYVAIALGIALVVDAISDPLVGSFSDNFRHRLGRRHPLMLVSVLPFSVFIFGLFAPPDQITEDATYLFIWLLLFTVGTRLSITFFLVPWNALFAELSEDYNERSNLLAFRFACAWIVGIAFSFSIYTFVFTGSEAFPQEQLNPDNYVGFALVLAMTIGVCGLLSTLFTLDQVRYLPQPQADHRHFDWRAFKEEVKAAVTNRDFVFLFFAVLASGVISGTNQALQIYVNTYFWGLDGDALRWLALALVGGFLAFLTVVPLQKRVDKKYILVACSVAIMAVTAVPVSLRLMGLAPDNGTPELVAIVVFTTTLVAYFGTLGLIMFASMVADTLDIQEYRTGLRQEGLFNTAMTFSGKATTAGGILIAGLLLDFVVRMPEAADVTAVTEEMIFRIGVLDAYVVPIFNVLWLWLALKYTITREHHAEIRALLSARS